MKYIFKYKVLKVKTITVESDKDPSHLWDELLTKYDGYSYDPQGEYILDESQRLYSEDDELLIEF